MLSNSEGYLSLRLWGGPGIMISDKMIAKSGLVKPAELLHVDDVMSNHQCRHW
jgi:hypothetical protein